MSYAVATLSGSCVSGWDAHSCHRSDDAMDGVSQSDFQVYRENTEWHILYMRPV